MWVLLNVVALGALAAIAAYVWYGRKQETLIKPEPRIKPSPAPDFAYYTANETVPPQDQRAMPKEPVTHISAAEKLESTEHGRIILEWLRKIRFADKTMQEAIDTGNPDDRASLKETLAQVADRFNDFRARIKELAPEVLQLPHMKKAEEVVKTFRHAIGLLAKLEIANSISDTMQISSDASMQIQQNMKNASIGDLMDKLQKAMDEAHTAMDMQAEAAERQQEQQDTAQEIAMNDQSRRRRRRRRRQQQQATMTSAKGAAKRVKASDLNGDGVADSLQGLSRTSQPIQIAAPGFDGLDMQKLRELGKALAFSTAQAKELMPAQVAVTDVREGDRIAPDDMLLSEQEKIKREREKDKQQGQTL